MNNSKSLEVGGKSPLLIFEDADIAKAVSSATLSILPNSGQTWMTTSRIYVQEGIAAQFIETIKSAMIQQGGESDPSSPGVRRGRRPTSSSSNESSHTWTIPKIAACTSFSVAEELVQRGYFCESTIIVNAPENSRVMREEIFGPMLCINTFRNEDEGLKRVKDADYGLYASVFTTYLSRSMRVAKELEAGAVGVNCTSPTMFIGMSMGGCK
ncbi:aldehyde dehydrogenase domain-containing protein [Truncatella angustata]|uniref:aldehyde dehydrogenase (NAD(+)) n=1 Tax=Truncatella angustata TaxID=152316 RepID=A0A9P8RLU3_9PEZI|nr:aldehyde dehydrogenase domain-containing protein [Truncatella angustata]KAH6646633.1 aldehyde dehydrogenase domain-containing protein [Truncatella angustata]